MKGISGKLMSGLLAMAIMSGLFAAAPMEAFAADGPFRVTVNPVGAVYTLNETAVALRATFVYRALAGLGYIDSEAPMKVQWYWSYDNSNAGRSNALGESAVAYGRDISHTTTHVPATDTVGVRYYYAVLTYAESITVNSGQSSSVPREAVCDPARIEVTAPGQGFRVKKTDENGNLLSGAVLALVPDGNQVASVKPHEAVTVNGYASFSASPGNYVLSEKSAPDGYVGSDDKYKITVTENGVFINFATHLAPYETITFVNTKKPGGSVQEHSFKVKKTDENGNPLSGAVLALVPDGGYVQDSSVKSYEGTTADGYVSFAVTPGYYILYEKQAPEGYNATDEKYYIAVTDTGVFINLITGLKLYETVTFVNKEIPQLNKWDHFAYMVGYPDGTFGPARNMTRAEAVVMFSRLLSKSINMSVDYRNTYYPDVELNKWYANQVCYMQTLGVLADYCRDGKFRPNEYVTRAEFATLAAHFDKLTLTDTNIFSDVPNSHWAVKYINSAAAKGWIVGYVDGTVRTFKPEANITRAEVVTLVNKMLERTADSAYLNANEKSLPRKYVDLTNAHWAYLPIMEASTGHDYIKSSSGENWTAVYQ